MKRALFGLGSAAAVVATVIILSGDAAWAQAAAPSWPEYRGAKRDGISDETFNWPEGGPKVAWRLNVGQGYSCVAVLIGKLYTMGNTNDEETVWCVDAATGKEIWKHTYPCKAVFISKDNAGSASTPTVDAKRVYTISQRGDMFCFEADTGKVVWSKKLKADYQARIPDHGYSCSPLVSEDLLIFEAGAKDGGALIAVNKMTGELVWKKGEGVVGYSSPVPYVKDGKPRVAALMGDCVLGLDARTGEQLWRFPYKVQWNITIPNPIVVGDKVFISSGYCGGAVLLDISAPAEPKVLWKTIEFSNQFTTPVLWKGYLYGFEGDNDRKPFLRCFDFNTGEQKWSQDGFGRGSLMLAGGKLLVMSEKGDLVIVDPTPDAYKELGRMHVLDGQCWTMPVLCGGKIYCRSHTGELVCLDVSAK